MPMLMEIPEVEYQVDLCLKSGDFKEIVGELSLFNEVLQLNCSEDKIVLKAHGDSGSATVEIKDTDIEEYAVEEDLSLSVSFWHKIYKCCMRISKTKQRSAYSL